MRKHTSFAKKGTKENPGIEKENAVTKLPEWNIKKDNDGDSEKWHQHGFGKSRCQSQKQEKIDKRVSQIVIAAA